MAGENFGTKVFYSEIGGHVLTPLFVTSLVYDEAKEIAHKSVPMLKWS
jgi:hypothetical protein